MLRELEELEKQRKEHEKDSARLDWLLENGFAIVPERGAGSFAEKVFDDRQDLDAYIEAQKSTSSPSN